MDKTAKIDKFLKELQELSKEVRLNPDRIYLRLAYYGIPLEEQNKSVKEVFDKLISKFKGYPGATTFVSPNWTYFCQFANDPEYSMYSTNPIKIYIPLKKEHLEENVSKIVKFLADNNIVHRSKLAKRIRVDNLVLRVKDKDGADKVINYINSTIPKEDLYECNPFCISDNKVALALDRYLSYNDILSKYLCLYINNCSFSNEVASYESFKNFMQLNLRLLMGKRNKNYILRFKDLSEDKGMSDEEFLANVNEITTLIVRNLENETKDFMYQLHSEVNKEGYFDELANFYSQNKSYYMDYNAAVKPENVSSKVTNVDRLLLISIIKATSEKYGIEKTKDLLNNYREERYIGAITRKDNLRDQVATSETFYSYITSLSTEELNEMIDKYGVQKETDYYKVDKPSNNENDEKLLISISETMTEKYGLEQAFFYINAYRESFNINSITRDNDLRSRVASSNTFHVYMASMSKEELFEFVKNHSKNKEVKTNTEEQNKYTEKEFILEQACKLTYNSAEEKGNNGKGQIFSALMHATSGDFDYFTRTNDARAAVANNISPFEIEKIAKMTLEKKGYVIKQKRDIYLFYPTYIEYLCEEQKKAKVK